MANPAAPSIPIAGLTDDPTTAGLVGVLAKRAAVEGSKISSVSQIVDARHHKEQARKLYASSFSPWRRALHDFVYGKETFNYIIFFFVFVNCVLAIFEKDGVQEDTEASITLFIFLDIITWIFVLEAIILMIAGGVWVRKFGFFSSKTNTANLILTIIALYDFFQRRAFPDTGSLRIAGVIARVGRLLRTFRTLAEIPSIRQLFDAIRKSATRLVDILILFIAFTLVVGLVGMQFFERSFKYRCSVPSWLNCSFGEDDVPCVNVVLPPGVASISPAQTLLDNAMRKLNLSSSSSSSGNSRYVFAISDHGSIHVVEEVNGSFSSYLSPANEHGAFQVITRVDPHQASLIVDDEAICQPAVAYNVRFDLHKAWSAAMMEVLTDGDFVASQVFANFGGGSGGNISSSYGGGGSSSGNIVVVPNTNVTSTVTVNSSAVMALLAENSTRYQIPMSETHNWNTLTHGVTCPYGSACVPHQNPERDFISFDTVFPAFISMYFVTFLEGWSMIAGFAMDARGSLSLYFFTFLVLAGALFMLNLVLAILVDAFTRSLQAIQQRDAALKEIEFREAVIERQQRLLLQQQNSGGGGQGNNAASSTPVSSPAQQDAPPVYDGDSPSNAAAAAIATPMALDPASLTRGEHNGDGNNDGSTSALAPQQPSSPVLANTGGGIGGGVLLLPSAESDHSAAAAAPRLGFMRSGSNDEKKGKATTGNNSSSNGTKLGAGGSGGDGNASSLEMPLLPAAPALLPSSDHSSSSSTADGKKTSSRRNSPSKRRKNSGTFQPPLLGFRRKPLDDGSRGRPSETELKESASLLFPSSSVASSAAGQQQQQQQQQQQNSKSDAGRATTTTFGLMAVDDNNIDSKAVAATTTTGAQLDGTHNSATSNTTGLLLGGSTTMRSLELTQEVSGISFSPMSSEDRHLRSSVAAPNAAAAAATPTVAINNNSTTAAAAANSSPLSAASAPIAAPAAAAPAPFPHKRLLDLFEGDCNDASASGAADSVPFVGVVLSTRLAVEGGNISKQSIEGANCCQYLLSRAKFYGRLIRFVVRSKIVTKTWFSIVSALLTFINIVLLACTWHGIEAKAELALYYTTSVIALLFAIEITIKLIALPFVRLARDLMNIVDLVVSIASIFEFLLNRSSTVTTLRCIRILRLLTVVDSLRDTVKILKRGLVATIPLIVVLLIFLYVYAVVGMALFSGKLCLSATPHKFSGVLDMFLRMPTASCADADPAHPLAPAFNFDNFGNSLLSTFVVFIGDNWAGLMALSVQRTNIFVSIWFLSCFTIAGFIVVNLFVAAMIEACAESRKTGSGGHEPEGDALFGGGEGGVFHHRASMFIASGAASPATRSRSNTAMGRGGGGGGGGSDDDYDDNDDASSSMIPSPFRFRSLSQLAASMAGRSRRSSGSASPSTATRSRVGSTKEGGVVSDDDKKEVGLESTLVRSGVLDGSIRDFSSLIEPSLIMAATDSAPPTPKPTMATEKKKRGGGSRRPRAYSKKQERLRAIAMAGENDDDFDMILDDQPSASAASPFRSSAGTSRSTLARNAQQTPKSASGGGGADADEEQRKQQEGGLHSDDGGGDDGASSSPNFMASGTFSGVDSEFAASLRRAQSDVDHKTVARLRVGSVMLDNVNREAADAAAVNAMHRKKMTSAQKVKRLARRALYGERAYSASQREEDKFGKLMLAAARVLGVEVNELSDFDRALLLPYFEEIRHVRKHEEAKHWIRGGVGYLIRHPLYRMFTAAHAVFSILTYVSFSNARLAPDANSNYFLAYTELINCIVVGLDVAFRIISLGTYTKNASRVNAGFFNSKLNIAKAIIALLCVGATISSFHGTLASTNALRLFSRCLPLWLFIPLHQPTMLILISVFDALVSLGNVGFMAFLVWITFSIMGTQLFRGGFYACSSSPNSDSWGDQTYTGDMIKTRLGCLNASYFWVPYRHNFDNMFKSMETLFGVATTDDWSTIAYLCASAVNFDVAPNPGWNMKQSLFCCAFILIAALFLLNVFIAVLVNAYFQTQNRMERNIRHSLLLGEAGDLLDPDQRDFYDLYRRALCFVKKPPSITFARDTARWWIRRVSRSHQFQLFFLLLSFTNVIVQFTAFTSAPPPLENLLITDLVFTIILFCMTVMKIFGSGFMAVARESYWSVVEVFVVLLSFSCTIAAMVLTYAPPSHFTPLQLENNLDLLAFLRQSRIFLLHRVMSATAGSRVLVDTIVRSSQTLASALMLLLLLFLTYASLGLTLFGRTPGRDVHTNFWTIPRGLYTLLAVATFDGWQDVMDAAGSSAPNCNPQFGDCGIPVVSPIFFMSFIVLGQWVGISLFVAILVESFSRSERQERLRLQEDDVKRFRRMWKKHCRTALGKTDATAASPLPISQLPMFLAELGAPLGPVSSGFVPFGGATSRQTTLEEFPDLQWQGLGGGGGVAAAGGAGGAATQPPQKGGASNDTSPLSPSARSVVLPNTSIASSSSPTGVINNSLVLPRRAAVVAPAASSSTPAAASASSSNQQQQQQQQQQAETKAMLQLPSLADMMDFVKRKLNDVVTVARGNATVLDQQHVDAATDRYATRADCEKLLTKLSLPTFVTANGVRCVAQYALFDALVRYYFGVSLPPRADLDLHELLLSSFGITRDEAEKQISKPSQRDKEQAIVMRRERGTSGRSTGHQSLPVFLPSARALGAHNNNSLGGAPGAAGHDPNNAGDDDGKVDDDGFDNIASPQGSDPQMMYYDVYSIDRISVGALFSVLKIQTMWRGARVRNKIRQLAQAAAAQHRVDNGSGGSDTTTTTGGVAQQDQQQQPAVVVSPAAQQQQQQQQEQQQPSNLSLSTDVLLGGSGAAHHLAVPTSGGGGRGGVSPSASANTSMAGIGIAGLVDPKSVAEANAAILQREQQKQQHEQQVAAADGGSASGGRCSPPGASGGDGGESAGGPLPREGAGSTDAAAAGAAAVFTAGDAVVVPGETELRAVAKLASILEKNREREERKKRLALEAVRKIRAGALRRVSRGGVAAAAVATTPSSNNNNNNSNTTGGSGQQQQQQHQPQRQPSPPPSPSHLL